MKIEVELLLADQLAWLDCATRIQYERSSWLARLLRTHRPQPSPSARADFEARMISTDNRYALGNRSIEISAAGVTETVGPHAFTSLWCDLEFWCQTVSHIFIVHQTLNSHIVPTRCFCDSSAKSDFLACLKKHLNEY
jgi:hypothetical protein